MSPSPEFSLPEQLKRLPSTVRPTVKAAIKTVKQIAPKANEIIYRSQPPRSSSAMWKIVRYSVDGANVVGIGTFPNHSTMFFYRGRELDGVQLAGFSGLARFRCAEKRRRAQASISSRAVRSAPQTHAADLP
jgi:hypothetical protein